VAYAIAVAFYSMLAIWRIHQATKREARRLQTLPRQPSTAGALVVETYSRPPDQIV